MNDFDLRKYLKNNLLLESKEYEKEMDDDQDEDMPYVDGKPVEEVELSTAVLQPVNTEVQDASSLAKAILDFVDQTMDKEAFKLESSSEMKIAITNLKALAAKSAKTQTAAAEPKIAAEGANIRAHDEMNAAAKRTEELIKIANELFPDIAKKQDGGKLINFKPLDISQRNQVYQKYTEGSTKIKENDYAPKDMAKDQKGNDPTADYEEKNANMNEYAPNPNTDPRTEQIIQMLKDMDIDGETMEYILIKVGMDDQMANQLVNNPAEYEDEVSRAVGESRELRGMAEEELHADSSTVHINGRAVDINSLDVDGVDPQDRPDFVDAYFVSGNYQDGDELSDEELDYLTSEYPEIVGDLANQY